MLPFTSPPWSSACLGGEELLDLAAEKPAKHCAIPPLIEVKVVETKI